MHNQTTNVGRAEHKLDLLCSQVDECGETDIETKVRFQDSVLDLWYIRVKIISSDLDITKYMDVSYIACNIRYKSSQHLSSFCYSLPR